MDKFEAKVLLRNLLKRISKSADGQSRFDGAITEDEVAALGVALEILGATANSPPPMIGLNQVESESVVDVSALTDEKSPPGSFEKINLIVDVLSLPPPLKGTRLCLDFGTAMSKATLVVDGLADEPEVIHVLELGRPGDQEEVSVSMLISSVFIDEDGLLWFGKMAVDKSELYEDGTRLRLDNIKRRLSEDGFRDQVDDRYNPTGIDVSYGDMVLAYLMFFTWAVQSCTEEFGFPRNLPRRFAMPCFPNEKMREVSHHLRKYLGDAQILADTFGSRVRSGLPLAEFCSALKALRQDSRSYGFVAEDLTEPLGVAGALLSWKTKVDMIVLVVDVGAGTSDLSLFRMKVDPEEGLNFSLEPKGIAQGISEAGNYLDTLLIAFIIKMAGISAEHSSWERVQGRLALSIRDYKETLFNEGSVLVSIPGIDDVVIELEEFRNLDGVVQFGNSLKNAMKEVLSEVDESWINWITSSPGRYLTVALTGGGASLPMVQSLARGEITVRGQRIPLAPALSFPQWLRENHADLESDFSRIAVSLGGARQHLINRGGETTVIGGDVRQTPKLGGYYQRGE